MAEHKSEITVMDFINYLRTHGIPVSGFAISALVMGGRPDTILVKPDDEEGKKIYEKVLEWVNATLP